MTVKIETRAYEHITATVALVDGEAYVKLSDLDSALYRAEPQGHNEMFQPYAIRRLARAAREAARALKDADNA